MEQLYSLGALDDEGLLVRKWRCYVSKWLTTSLMLNQTRLGRKMAEFPLEPPLSKMVKNVCVCVFRFCVVLWLWLVCAATVDDIDRARLFGRDIDDRCNARNFCKSFCVNHIAFKLLCAQSVQNVFYRPKEKQTQVRQRSSFVSMWSLNAGGLLFVCFSSI